MDTPVDKSVVVQSSRPRARSRRSGPTTSRTVKLLCYISALAAWILLLNPKSTYLVALSTIRSATNSTKSLLLGKGTGDKDRDFDDSSQEASKPAPRIQCLTGNVLDPPELSQRSYPLEAYRTATAEVRERINQEQILFALKFTIVGGILLALFSMSKTEQFERFIQRRRTAVFFSAALLTSSVIDIRLRFDIQMVEILGKWMKQAESNLHNQDALGYPGWETYLEKAMRGLGLPVMRCFSLSLTALLFLVTVYIFVILPRGSYEGTRRIFRACALVMFALLAFLGGSYEKGTWHIALGISLLGFLALVIAMSLKKQRDDVVKIVGPLVRRLRYPCADSKNSPDSAHAVSLRIATTQASLNAFRQSATDARMQGRREEMEKSDAAAIRAEKELEQLAKELKSEQEAQDFVNNATRYVQWVSRLRNPRKFLSNMLEGLHPIQDEKNSAENKTRSEVEARLRGASVPEESIPRIWDILVTSQKHVGAHKLSEFVDSFSTWFWWHIPRSDWKRLRNLLSEDVDEVESAEDFLWKVYFDIQLSLRTGGLRRWPLTINVPAENAEKVGHGRPAADTVFAD